MSPVRQVPFVYLFIGLVCRTQCRYKSIQQSNIVCVRHTVITNYYSTQVPLNASSCKRG